MLSKHPCLCAVVEAACFVFHVEVLWETRYRLPLMAAMNVSCKIACREKLSDHRKCSLRATPF